MKFILKITVFWFVLSNQVNLQAAQADTEEPRWFEVEVIVFKSNRSDGLFAESWDDKAELTKPDNLIDFVQPYQEKVFPHSQVNLGQSTSDSVNSNQAETSPNQTVANSETTDPATSVSLAAESETMPINPILTDEKPFKTLQKELLQLSNEAKSLTRHPDYQVLFHQAWRQPVLNSKQASHIRIAGGQDFSDQYKYDGSKKIFKEQFPEFSIETNDLSYQPNQVSEAGINQQPQFQHQNSTSLSDSTTLATSSSEYQSGYSNDTVNSQDTVNSSITEEIKFGNLIPELIPMAWVPELDGDIKIYLGRYLHIKTNLFLRRPDKEEVEVIDLDMFNSDMISSLTDADNLPTAESGLDAIKDFQTDQFNLGTQEAQNPQDNIYNFNQSVASTQLPDQQKSQFSWEIDDNFLETESEKMYIERLFNYPVSQSRRVRSGELHFFDHPLVGVLILISPYELEKEESEVNQLLSPSL